MPPAKRDYYEVLGVDRNTPKEEIKRSYRRLAKQYHPDMAQGMDRKQAEEKFKELSEAYEVLMDDHKRALYDQHGHAGVEQQVWGGQGFDWSRFTRTGDIEDFFGRDFLESILRGRGSIFNGFFSGANARVRRASRGRDLRLDLTIGLREVATGGRRELEIPQGVACSLCGGSGAEGGQLTTCPECRGTGQVSHVQRRGFGQLVTVTTCQRCGGRGRWPEKPCPECRGSGTTRTTTRVAVDIPRGAYDGLTLRLGGKGEPGATGPGDLYIELHVEEEAPFRQHGRDLMVDLAIPYPIAALGGEVEVPTLDGRARLKVAPGTQAGAVLKLRGKGLPDLEGRRGDELVRVTVEVPTDLSAEERRLLQRLLELRGQAGSRGGAFRWRV